MSISGKEVALVLSDHFDANEFNSLHNCFSQAGALVSIVGDAAGQKLMDWNRTTEVTIEVGFEEARSYDFDAIVISNGYSPDKIRVNEAARSLVLNMFNSGKVIGVIDHGIQVLITLGILKGKSVTGSPSIKVDIENAGAKYFNEPVVVDGNLVSGRGLDDVKAFCNAVIDELRRLTEFVA